MRSKIFFILAIVMGLITTALFYNYINEVQTEVIASERTKEVVVAKERINANTIIRNDMLQVKSLPESAVHYQAFSSIADVAGLYTTAAVEEGEIILAHRVNEQASESHMLSRKVNTGFRAVSVGLNFVQSVSNMIFPDDYVDVIVSELVKVGDEKVVQSELILQRVKVLAIGKQMLEPNEGEPQVEYTSVTLELNNIDAVSLVNASERGQIQLILHSRIMPPKEGANYEQSNTQ
ncbi:Flp pilus assembly protein CpaB [Desulfuribacillus alkaliarsenatis]|uniref:Flp pilus assembly protein CpaB n=1 Tax=Desulfuribacillus alkaliarsenatis TaxID=766136 RepID=A0A1E5G038_9FIRM|nr:Flp pilus assembly protein CpaB [Desulfuribacillus alkaliarsenatis]OEF96197.1 Flp pilus assembly protein CpaB [Desulfuribacillus alkaliarsenatis]